MIAPPFLGEFGWLVAMWVPFLRHVRRKMLTRSAELHVLCEPGHEFLFEDFATSVKPIEVNVTRRDCQNAWVDGSPVRKAKYEEFARAAFPKTRAHVITPEMMKPLIDWPSNYAPRLKVGLQDHRAYFEGSEKNPNLVAVHVRSCVSKQPERNWKGHNAEEVVRMLRKADYRVIAVGSFKGSLCPEGAVDLRGEPLRRVCEELAKASLIIGPSSGPLHLANYCLTPAVWWSSNRKDVDRYKSAWNPFKLPNRRVQESWDPDPDEVFSTADLLLAEKELGPRGMRGIV